MLFSNTSWACFCSQRIDETFVAKFGWDWQNYTNKVAFILYGGSLIVRQNTSEQNMLNGSEIWFGIEKNEGNIMDIKKEYERWLANATADADVAAELKTLDDAKIEDAFYRDLAFGTGGLRGVIGAGTNRMNIYTVAKASQGLADYLKKNYAEPSVAIGYDSRIKSNLFAKTAAEVLAANGIKVRIYKALMPVPALSFATRYYNCNAGIMVTASHNPAKYNGYKCYNKNGYQMTDDEAAETYHYIEKVDYFTGIKKANFDAAVADGTVEYIGEKMMTAFLDAVETQCMNRGVCQKADLKVIYTPLNGTGNKPVRAILDRIGVPHVYVVPEQELPDGNFPTCPYPNPEIREAMQDGEGEAVRNSETLSRSTFYYAIRLADGSILRLSKDARSIYSIFSQALPMMAGIFIVLLILCMVAAKVLTAKLIAPIEKLAENIGECTEMQTYEELTPFMVMIRKQHEDIMKNARMRQEFSANVSHELKTPLTSISGYAELIETGMASEQDTVRFAHGIHNSANRLLTLINDIIRLSELDGTEGEADTELLNLHEMAQNCVEMLSMSAEKHNVTIALSGTECYVTANRQMMEELLYNLCDNAIRYNNLGGSVDVQTYAREDHTYLIVKDTGIGISKEHQERIFERFYRVDKSRSKSTGGTGLGLAIVKHIIAKSHANLELESEPGKGTTIKVVF